jgi:hypothetical protein
VNPCVFTMPNDSVSITANFIQSQTLYTSYTGYGQLTPSCPSGCQVPVGSSVSIVAIPASGWQVLGYHLTGGVSCGSAMGYVCSFTMPNFPVTFQVTFTETTTTMIITMVSSSTIKTSVTGTAVVQSATTSTATTSTVSVTTIGETTTTINYSTSTSSVTQTQSSSFTQFSTVTTNETAVTMAVQNPLLELALAGIILFSVLMIGTNLIRRSRHQPVVCARCGFNNPSRRKYCVNCGEPLKGS